MLNVPLLRNTVQTMLKSYHGYSLRILALFLAITLGLSLIQPALAALVWQIQTVDSTGKVGLYNSLALDSSGNPVISYYSPTNGDLKLVHCGNTTCASGNTIVTVEDSTATVGQYSSLALDSNGNPVISYFDLTNSNLKLAHCGNATCASGNTIVTVDSTGNVGLHTSLALDNNGNPVISYYDLGGDNLKLAHCGDATCSSGNTIVTVDSTGNVGGFTSLTLDSSGNPIISYYDDTNRDLKLVHCGDATCASGNTIVTVDSTGNVGLHTSLVLDNSGNPVISYYDLDSDNLKLAHCGDATCSSGNTIVTVDSTGNVGQYSSLALDSNGQPVISYYDAINADLKVVYCGDVTCSSGNTRQTVDSAGDVGSYTALMLDSSGNPVISYYNDTSGDLKVARLVGDTTPPSVTINQAADQVDPANSNPLLFSASFSEDVTGFTETDITLNGTANLASASITVNGGPRDYTISISGAVGNGTVIATIAAAVATDSDGNLTTASTSSDNSVTVNFDSTPPVITPVLTPATPNGQNGWYVSDVMVSFTCADEAGGSGLASNTVAGATLNTDGANQSVTNTGQCIDNAGNVATPVTVNGINLDKTLPTLNPTVSPNPVNVGGTATVNAGAADTLAGLASQSCAALDTSSPGVKSVTCTATDNAGHTTSATVNYTVQGVLIGACGPYPVYQVGSSYVAPGWAGAIKVGTSGNNTLTGGSGRDLMLGLGGNDKLDGKGGDDVLCGGDGVDLVLGLAGNDILDGGKGNDVLNGGSGDFDQLLAGDGNDVLLDGDGVAAAQGGAGNDVLTIALRNGWRDANGQPRFTGLTAGYGNDAVGLAILNPVPFFVDISGDEHDNPASPLEGTNDGLALGGIIDPASIFLKFENVLVVSADAQSIPSEESGAEFLSEPVGEEAMEVGGQTNRLFLPLINR